MRFNLQPAYILHSRPYRDSSMLLEVLTAEQGRISLVARGARRKTRGGSGSALLQPFIPLLLSFSGRTELKNLNATEAAGRPLPLPGERLFSGLYLNELLVRLLHRHDPHPQLFAAYGSTLGALAAEAEIDDVLRRFEFALLGELGYGFELDIDGSSGEAVAARDWYHYHPDFGLVARGPLVDPARPAFQGADLLAIAANDFGGTARLTAKRLLRLVLAQQLGDAPLRSRELFRVQAGSGREPESAIPEPP
jgi:DNA repair protein RecO (recombination protein O)